MLEYILLGLYTYLAVGAVVVFHAEIRTQPEDKLWSEALFILVVLILYPAIIASAMDGFWRRL